MAYANKLAAHAEEYIWNNWKFYLLSFPTCLLDLVLKIKDPTAENPYDRYVDFPKSLEEHVSLGSYTTGRAAQFTNTPFVTVNIQAIPMGGCSCRVIMGFDVVYATDTPKANDGKTYYVGSSPESVAEFRANIMTALDEMFYYAYDEEDERAVNDATFTQSFMDRMMGQEVVNPTNPNEKKQWQYNVRAFVDEDAEISEVSQLKREDRYTGLNVFHVVYKFDLNRLWSDKNDYGC